MRLRGWGSSPLTRGKRIIAFGIGIGLGLIPAHAGKTGRGGKPYRRRRAHPRSRGENVCARALTASRSGSSPLTRGKPVRASRCLARLGLIPAHAGKTKGKAIVSFDPGAHPRSRGENDFKYLHGYAHQGSSPLTRGKPILHSAASAALRLIPAHAGKTLTVRVRRPITRAHPRSRGENPLTGRCPASGVGSSPLTRGKRPLVESPAQPGGLIPAHAGKTVRSAAVLVLIRAHPRSRGENTGTPSPNGLLDGSSPLTRGKRDTRAELLVGRRLIPAHAGKTPVRTLTRRLIRAHPRSRGENWMSWGSSRPTPGSSPLTRGKPTWQLLLAQASGLIPAHAGKTRGAR